MPNGRAIRYADEKAALFFVTDISAVGSGSYDSWIDSPDNRLNAFTAEDLRAINKTMGGRTAAKHWSRFTTGTDFVWLKAIHPDWDLIEMPDDDWGRSGCADRLREALIELNGPYRRASVVTKLLHIKRPRLIPICDSFVAATMERSAWDAESTASLILAIREAGRANIDVLRTVSSRLESIGCVRPLVRILDALLWFEPPYSGPPGPYGLFEEWLVRWHGGRLFF